MEAPWPTTVVSGTDRPPDDRRGWLRVSVGAALGLLWLVVVLLVVRRLAGGLVRPLSAEMLFAVAALAIAWTVGARLLWHQAERRRAACAQARPLIRIGLSGALLLIALTLTLPGTSWLAGALFWSVLVAAAILLQWSWRRSAESVDLQSVKRTKAVPVVRDVFEEESTSKDDAMVCQQLTRTREADGVELLYGTMRCDLAAGQRTAALHVAFCPPFATSPEVDFEQGEGPEAALKIGQLLPYGVRIDVRLTREPEGPVGVVVELSARGQTLKTG